MFKIPASAIPSAEELEKRHHARVIAPFQAACHEAKKNNPGAPHFISTSLDRWMEEVKASGIPHVPAEVVGRIPVDVIKNFEEPSPEDMIHWKALGDARADLKANEMLRWEICSGLDMKMVMGDGGQKITRAWHAEMDGRNGLTPAWRSALSPDDPRFFDLCFEHPGEDMAILKRPWIEARRFESHPVEYRVFIQDNDILGISNYYVQRDLPMRDEVRNEVRRAIELTQQLLDSMVDRQAKVYLGSKKDIDGHFDPEKISCTMDFLVSESGQMLFLEAGPPFGLNAHPCAFQENVTEENGRNVISVRGVALGLGKPVIALEDFLDAEGRPVNEVIRQRKAPKP